MCLKIIMGFDLLHVTAWHGGKTIDGATYIGCFLLLSAKVTVSANGSYPKSVSSSMCTLPFQLSLLETHASSVQVERCKLSQSLSHFKQRLIVKSVYRPTGLKFDELFRLHRYSAACRSSP